jgi:hypothetical protein
MTNLDFTNFVEAIGKNNWNPEKGGIYDYFIDNPPVDEDGNRKSGTSYQSAYWTGFDFPFRTPRGDFGSNARLAWKAGRDTKKNITIYKEEL